MRRMNLVEILRTAAREFDLAIGPHLNARRRPAAEFEEAGETLPSRGSGGQRVAGAFRGAERIPLSPELSSVAGYVRISEPVEIGDVLVIDRLQPGCMRLGDAAADSAVVGVVSGEPRGGNTLVPATFSGVVRCKVDADYGSITPGDLLTVSPHRGHAMLSSFRVPGTILGTALEPLGSGASRIKVLVTLR